MVDILMCPPLPSYGYTFSSSIKKLCLLLMEAKGHGTTCPNWLSGGVCFVFDKGSVWKFTRDTSRIAVEVSVLPAPGGMCLCADVEGGRELDSRVVCKVRTIL